MSPFCRPIQADHEIVNTLPPIPFAKIPPSTLKSEEEQRTFWRQQPILFPLWRERTSVLYLCYKLNLITYLIVLSASVHYHFQRAFFYFSRNKTFTFKFNYNKNNYSLFSFSFSQLWIGKKEEFIKWLLFYLFLY